MADLHDLGLSDYEVRVYHGLLKKGQATAQETADEADVPEGRVYDVLNNLAKHGLVQPCETQHPKMYTPVEPTVALSRLLEAKQAQLDTTQQRYETLVSEVADELATIDPVQYSYKPATICFEESSSLLTDQLATATQEVLLTMATPTPKPLEGDPALGEALSAAIQNDADVSVLMHPDHAHIDEKSEQMLVLNQEELDIRVCDRVRTTVACLDGERLVLENPAAFQQPLGFLSIDSDQSKVIDQFRTSFIRHWERVQTTAF